ncbi:lysine-rich arabinogalactan protein 19-like [Triticum urartu]|uniref:lysine-rich arabinogalactan protein 19-like n=1 Tax=Triticum urartu TaxID=4572 RepID=UPI002042DBD0|nr:lysine-rich arabinogalactan protein 19-like [Triticum urartu]
MCLVQARPCPKRCRRQTKIPLSQTLPPVPICRASPWVDRSTAPLLASLDRPLRRSRARPAPPLPRPPSSAAPRPAQLRRSPPRPAPPLPAPPSSAAPLLPPSSAAPLLASLRRSPARLTLPLPFCVLHRDLVTPWSRRARWPWPRRLGDGLVPLVVTPSATPSTRANCATLDRGGGVVLADWTMTGSVCCCTPLLLSKRKFPCSWCRNNSCQSNREQRHCSTGIKFM